MYKKKVLVLGSGGREHAIVWKLSKSGWVDKIFCCPGNAGTSKIAENINLDLNNFFPIMKFVKNQNIELTIIGPEALLANGIVDVFRENGLAVFGPTKRAAEIESSKAFSKTFMKKYNIPTADYKIFTKDRYNDVIDYIYTLIPPIVVKADGLAAGKGVIIANNFEEAVQAVKDIIQNNIFGHAGDQIIIEEFLQGDEASIFAITDGVHFVTLPAAQDHKRILDNDRGKNTGGMGAYAPTKLITYEILKQIEDEIIKSALTGMLSEGRTYTGCLYCGLMITVGGPKVIEFNCRFGDPETQVVLPLLSSDFFELLYLSSTNNLLDYDVKFYDTSAVCVILASGGYPDTYEINKQIFGLDTINEERDNVVIFHAGTKTQEDKTLTSGGRVLGITALGEFNDLKNTIEKTYQAVKKISFEGVYYRTDIGKKGLKY